MVPLSGSAGKGHAGMSTTMTDRPIWAIGDIEPVIAGLRATIGILGHLITVNSSRGNEVDDDAWRKVESDLMALTGRVDELWHVAWDQHIAEREEHEAALEAAIATVTAKKAAPGSREDLEKADARWRLLAAAVAVATLGCTKAGYPIQPLQPDEPEPAPEPPMRW